MSLLYNTPKDSGSWFGYYNYDTLNHDQTKMLSNRTENDAQKIEKGMKIKVGFYDIPSGKWHQVGVSDSFNWPQGCMLQWLPGKGHENEIIYNTSNGIHNIAKIVNIETSQEREIDWSIYGLTPDGKKSITLNFERSHWCRSYHYESIANEKNDVRLAEDDGIFEVDLENNLRKRIVNIQDVVNIDKEDYFDIAKHWLEHIMISPSGKRFCFLHRFTIGSLDDYETRLFIADIDGKNLQLIDGWRDYYWSHFAWNGDESFAIYSYRFNNHQKVISSIKEIKDNSKNSFKTVSCKGAKSLFHLLPSSLRDELNYLRKGQTSYYQYYKLDEHNKFILCENWKNRVFEIDGHPSFTSNGEYMITDTYPNRKKMQKLIVFDIKTKKSLILGEFYAGLYKKYGSCDLHPKLCKDNNFIAIDSADEGCHHMMLFKLDWKAIQKDFSNR